MFSYRLKQILKWNYCAIFQRDPNIPGIFQIFLCKTVCWSKDMYILPCHFTSVFRLVASYDSLDLWPNPVTYERLSGEKRIKTLDSKRLRLLRPGIVLYFSDLQATCFLASSSLRTSKNLRLRSCWAGKRAKSIKVELLSGINLFFIHFLFKI